MKAHRYLFHSILDSRGMKKKKKRAVGPPNAELRANLKSISHRCHPILVAFVWELTKETIDLPLGCLQGGEGWRTSSIISTRTGTAPASPAFFLSWKKNEESPLASDLQHNTV